jgi:glycogen(starch) synthase
MKILMLGWELPPHYTGGMGLVCYQLCKHLANSGADIEFILPFTADFPNIDFMKINPALPLGVDQVLRQEGGGTYDSQYFTYVAKNGVVRGAHMNEHQQNYSDYVLKLVLYGEYDVIHAHDWLTLRAGLAAKQATGLPLIVHMHATEFDRAGGKRGNPLIHEIEYIGLHIADRIVAVSEATRQTIMREYDIPADKIEVVHNAIDFEIDDLAEQGSVYPYIESMRANGYRVVLGAGRLTIQKGFMNLLYAMKAVVERQPKTILLLVGGGELYHELVAKSAELGIARNVIIVGYLNGTGRAWRDAFRVSDLFVMPSISEPFGLTPFEALTFGAPVLMTKQSGASEVLKNALKVDFWDIDEMANQICSVVANDSLASTLYKNGSDELTRLTWTPSVQKLLKIYDREISGAAV